MSEFKYTVLESPKIAGVSLEQVKESLVRHFPNHAVTVDDEGDQWVAVIQQLSSSKRTVVAGEFDEEVDSADESDSKPPFLKKKDDEKDDVEGNGEDAPVDKADEAEEDSAEGDSDDDSAKDAEDNDDDTKDKGDKKDSETGDLKKALEALKTLEHVLPKLKEVLESADIGGDKELDIPLGDNEIPPPPGEAAADVIPGGPEGPGGPGGKDEGTPLSEVGPPAGPPVPPAPKRRPPVPQGPDKREKPAPGIPGTFARRNRIAYYPVKDTSGNEVGMDRIAGAIKNDPRYDGYETRSIKREGDQYVAHLRLKD